MSEPQDLIVRVGKPVDIDAVMALAEAVAGENAPVAPNMTKILHGIWQALHKQNGIVGIVGPVNGPPQGFILMRIGQPWYSDHSVIEECGVYVHPDWRAAKGGRAAKLYQFAKSVADQLQLPLMIGVLSRHRTESKLRYYERFFGDSVGGFYLYHPAAPAAVAAE